MEAPEDKINIVDYHLKHKQYVIDRDCRPEDVVQAYQISENLVKTFRKYVKENFPEIGLQVQEAYLDLPEIFHQFFGLKVVITEELKKEMLKLLLKKFLISDQQLSSMPLIFVGQSTNRLLLMDISAGPTWTFLGSI